VGPNEVDDGGGDAARAGPAGDLGAAVGGVGPVHVAQAAADVAVERPGDEDREAIK
jgi:hypothetical protein